MLKQYLLENLKAGMVLGRAVYEDGGTVLLEKGTVLTLSMIDSLLTRPIFSVYIEEQPIETTAIPKTETEKKETKLVRPEQGNLLDTAYIECYAEVFAALEGIFQGVSKFGEVNTDDVANLVASGKLLQLCDGMRAITQIHNMHRDGRYLLHHSLHVAILAGLMGKWLNLPVERLYKLIIAGMLHDVGKLKISSDILNKPGRLTLSELKIIHRHPVMGHEILRRGQFMAEEEILLGVLQHHERQDGSGYAEGLRGDKISSFARILAIMDIYDAMVTNRVYAKKISPFEVFETLSLDINNGKLDAKYGILFIRKVCHALSGSWLRLSNGSKAKIVYIDESRVSALPIVQTEAGEFIDMNTSELKIGALLMGDEI